MKVSTENKSETEIVVKIVADETDLKDAKLRALKKIQPSLSSDGFRKGKVPLNLIEKNVDEKTVNTEALDEAVNSLLIKAFVEKKLRVLNQPNVEVTKFVPDQELEFSATVSVLAPIKLADYKKIKKKQTDVKVSSDDVEKVIDNLRLRSAEKKEVDRAAKTDDEVWVDFVGNDEKGGEIPGAKGNDYPLRLGSDTFIPGFEDNLVGVKKGEEREFKLTFPKDYGHKPLAGKKVVFKTKTRLVKEVVLPKLDDKFAASLGPFKTVDELKNDVKEQLLKQKLDESNAKLQDEIVEEILKKSAIVPPESFVEEQKQSILNDFKQNLTYRGITLSEFLKQQELSEEEYIKKEVQPQAEKRVRVGLLLSEVAEKEEIDVTDAEVSHQLELMRGQMPSNPQFDSEQAQKDIRNRLITQKTLDKLVNYATK